MLCAGASAARVLLPLLAGSRPTPPAPATAASAIGRTSVGPLLKRSERVGYQGPAQAAACSVKVHCGRSRRGTGSSSGRRAETSVSQRPTRRLRMGWGVRGEGWGLGGKVPACCNTWSTMKRAGSAKQQLPRRRSAVHSLPCSHWLQLITGCSTLGRAGHGAPATLSHLKGVTHRPSSRPHCLPLGCSSASAGCSCQVAARLRALPSWRAAAAGSRGRGMLPAASLLPLALPLLPPALPLPLPSLPLPAHTVGWQGSQGGSMPSAVPQHTNSWTT